jgi:hypothetical protein
MLFLALTKHVAQSGDILAEIENPLELLPVLEENITAELAKSPPSQSLPVSPSPSLDSLIQWPRFARAAARVLWLAQRTPEEILALRSLADMQAAIDQWAETALPDDQLIEAVRLALLIRTEHKDKIVIPRPGKDAAKATAGN